MVDNGAKTASLRPGSVYQIPKGYHNGSGKVTVTRLSDETVGTATEDDILAGKTAWVDGVKVVGSMINQGAKTTSLNADQSYTIPAGYHNGSGKVTANSLANQTSATAIAGDILSGKNAWVNGVKVNGSMANQGAKTSALPINGRYVIPAGYHNGSGYITQSIPIQGAMTLNPGTSQKVGNVSGKYMTGNITVPAVNISPSIIKKNHRLTLPDGSFVNGTFEGYLPGTKKYLLSGRDFHDVESHSNSIEYGSGHVGSNGLSYVIFNKIYDLIRYTRIEIYAAYNKGNGNSSHYVIIEAMYPYNNTWLTIGRINTPAQENVGDWFTLPIKIFFSETCKLKMSFYNCLLNNVYLL